MKQMIYPSYSLRNQHAGIPIRICLTPSLWVDWQKNINDYFWYRRQVSEDAKGPMAPENQAGEKATSITLSQLRILLKLLLPMKNILWKRCLNSLSGSKTEIIASIFRIDEEKQLELSNSCKLALWPGHNHKALPLVML
jgi:hypothetical protein